MGASPATETVTPKIPPPPPGFVPEQQAGSGAVPPPPPGFVPEKTTTPVTPQVPTEKEQAANPTTAPNPIKPTEETKGQAAADIALSALPMGTMIAAGAGAAPAAVATGPFAPLTEGAAGTAGYALGADTEDRARRAGVGPPRLVKAPTIGSTVSNLREGAETEFGGRAGGKLIEMGTELATPAIRRALASPEKAQALLERGLVPGGAKAEDQELLRRDIQRSSKYIAPETRNFPLKRGEGEQKSQRAAASRKQQALHEPLTYQT